MSDMWKIAAVLVCLIACGPLRAGNAEQQQRIAALEGKLLAPCCYMEPVGRHQSEIALRMRLEIARLVESGKTDGEIVDAYVRQYGAKVIADFTPAPTWATYVPWLLAMAGSIGLGWWIRRMVRAYKAAEASL